MENISFKQYKTETTFMSFTVNTNVDIAKIGGVKDYAICNEGATNIIINNQKTLVPTQLLSFAGYESAIKADNIQIDFVGGVGVCVLIINKIFNC